MARLFLKGLRKIYRVDEGRLRIALYCYSNQNSEVLKNYWSNILEIPQKQFIKPYIRSNFDEKNIDKMKHGVVHIRYSDERLLMQIKAEIDIIQASLNKLGWRSGKRVWL